MKLKNDLIDSLRKQWLKEKPDLDTSAIDIVGRIFILNESHQKDVNSVLKKYGLGYTDFDVLATIKRSGTPYSLRPADLLNSVLIQSGSLTSCIDRLEKAGLVVRERAEKDRRSLTVKLTKKGKEIADQAAIDRFKVASEQTEHLTESEKDSLINLLRKLKK